MEMPQVDVADTAVKNAVVNVVVSFFGVAIGMSSMRVENATRRMK